MLSHPNQPLLLTAKCAVPPIEREKGNRHKQQAELTGKLRIALEPAGKPSIKPTNSPVSDCRVHHELLHIRVLQSHK